MIRIGRRGFVSVAKRTLCSALKRSLCYLPKYLALMLVTMWWPHALAVNSDFARPSATRTIPPVAEARLAKNVRVLSDNENSSIIERSRGRLTFSRPLSFKPGQVVLGADLAFKVIATTRSGAGTVVEISEPELDELFDSVSINGQFTASRTFNAEELLPIGSVQIASGLTATIVVEALYDYDQTKGGLQAAVLDFQSSVGLHASADLKVQSAESTRITVGAVRIPIPLSIFDHVLRHVGVRLASIYVPFYLSAELEAQFSAGVQAAFTGSGSVRFEYDLVNGATISDDLDGSFAASLSSPITPAGAQPLTESELAMSVSVGMRPALAFLNEVSLLGADVTLSGVERATLLAPLPGESPPYCLTLTPLARARIFGFIKTVGIKEKTTDAYERILYNGAETEVGSCLIPSKIQLTSSTGAVFGQPTTLSVEVSPATNSAGGIAPTGVARITIGDRSCEGLLAQSSPATSAASCSIVPLISGLPVQATLTYEGDSLYASSMATGPVNVAKAETVIGMSSQPNPSFVNNPVVLSGSVLPEPAGEGEPTGSIAFAMENGGCIASIAGAGHGECSVTFSSAGVKPITSTYSGDINFNGSTSTVYTHTVTDDVILEPITRDSCTSVTYETNIGTFTQTQCRTNIGVYYTGPDTRLFSFQMISTVTDTAFGCPFGGDHVTVSVVSTEGQVSRAGRGVLDFALVDAGGIWTRTNDPEQCALSSRVGPADAQIVDLTTGRSYSFSLNPVEPAP